MIDEQKIYSISRPSPKLLTYYMIQCCYLPPLTFLGILPLLFRYNTLKYEFDEEGISMSWGILFRRQVNLTYARIQDIHVTAGVVQRYFGLADLHIQTASGSATAEMKIEGLLEFEEIRDFIYTKMRGYKSPTKKSKAAVPQVTAGSAVPAQPNQSEQELIAALQGIQGELRASRQLMEQMLQQKNQGGE